MAAAINDSEDDVEFLEPGAIDAYSASVGQDAFASKVEAGDTEALQKLRKATEKLQQHLKSETLAVAERLDADGS